MLLVIILCGHQMAQLSVILILSHGSDEIVIIVHELPVGERNENSTHCSNHT